MKKTLSILMVLVMALSCTAFFAQAEEDKPGEYYVPAFSFDFLEEGFQLGGLDDEGIDGEQKYLDCKQTVGIYFDITASENRAFHGKALNFKSLNGGDGVYVGMYTSLLQTPDKRTNFEGATDFVCYIDMDGWGSKRGVRPVLSVTGMDLSGESTGTSNTYYPAKDKPVYMQDADKNWVPVAGVENGTLDLPENYKGFIRVPISSFMQVEWDGPDVNGKLDLNEVFSIAVEVGCYNYNDGNVLIVDEIGFLGDFADKGGIPASFLVDGKIPGAEESKPEEDQSEGEKSEAEGSKAEDKKESGSISPMTWLLIASGAVVVIAVVVIVILVVGSKKKEKADEKKDDAPEEPKEE